MPFEIVRNDIVNMQVDAIVNTANPRPRIGSGTDAAVHAKAGPMLLAARKLIGSMEPGEARITPGFRLPAKHVIHTVGPIWKDGSHGEAEQLRRCYGNSLQLARRHRIHSVAFPLISTGNYGFPKPLALQIAAETIREFLRDNEMQIYLVVFDRSSYELSSQLSGRIRSYIDERYAREAASKEYGFPARDTYEDLCEAMPISAGAVCTPAPEEEPEDDLIVRIRREDRREKAAEPPCAAAPEEAWWDDVPDGAGEPEEEDWDEAAEEPEWDAPLPAEPKARPKARKAPSIFDLAELKRKVNALDTGFSETLLGLIDASGKTDADIYKKANIDRKLFSKIRKNPHYKPSKATALAFAIALELDLEGTRDLIGRAGYALSGSSTFDIIVEYFIVHGHYDVIEINMTLFEFDQPLLGASNVA